MKGASQHKLLLNSFSAYKIPRGPLGEFGVYLINFVTERRHICNSYSGPRNYLTFTDKT